MTKLNAPLYDAVTNYAAKARFHMPGHGGTPIDGGLYLSAPFDITELPFSDNLKNPSGVIKDAERLFAETYSSEDALLFATGATGAVQSALYAARERFGKSAVIAPNCHCSVHSALRLFGMRSVVLGSNARPMPKNRENRIDGDITPDAAAAVLDDTRAGILVLTSPDYYGRALDLAGFKEVTESRGVCLVVDSAHGAHFAFSPLLPPPASLYADLTVYGAHKTMPVFTGGAVLCGSADLIAKSRFYRSEYMTTSPNYVVLASLDYARAYLSLNGRAAYEKVFTDILTFKRALPQFTFTDNSDFTKLYFDCPADAPESAGVLPEMFDGSGSLLIVTPFNSDKLKYLADSLKTAAPLRIPSNECPLTEAADIICKNIAKAEADREGNPTENVRNKSDLVEIEDAAGCVSEFDIGAYPPGVPRVLAGAVITDDDVIFMKKNKYRLFNLVKGKVCVII
ncbi:MAG: aminotransferase class I/II-fold pyridoxal phosphate-dependent enzyme [Clostridiales bacterium]|jgi:arginine/lysine/ornithine decarboxylase|nr:aminotransferase class I/II-fold pyridoxal phosphate-dependent enzyme [Clostridiales bacterium]